MTATVVGIDAIEVEVEVHVTGGLPGFNLVGLPTGAVREGAVRIRSALQNSGFQIGSPRVTVNLAPADLRKNGAAFDLPIAIGILCSKRLVTMKRQNFLIAGELSLDGRVKPIRGALSLAEAALREGRSGVILPYANAKEALLIPGIQVFGVRDLLEATKLISGESQPTLIESAEIRNVTFDELVNAYSESVHGLIEGGVDALMVETIFDTLNAKAALFAINTVLDDLGIDIPIMISGTITDASGRTLSGQTAEAFWYSVKHVNPLSIGLNCAFGAEQMRPFIAELSRLSGTNICAFPNAGLPNEMGDYDESPEMTSDHLKEWAESGLVNLVGGCCGTTPDHIRAIAGAVAGITPRTIPEIEVHTRLSGLEPLVLNA